MSKHFENYTTPDGTELVPVTYKPKGEDHILIAYIQPHTVESQRALYNSDNEAAIILNLEHVNAGTLNDTRNNLKANRIPVDATAGVPLVTFEAMAAAEVLAQESGSNGLAIYREAIASVGEYAARLGRTKGAVDKLTGLVKTVAVLELQDETTREKVRAYVEGWYGSLGEEHATTYANQCAKWLEACDGVSAEADNPEDDF